MLRESVVSFWALRTAAERAESLVAVEEWEMVWLLFLAVVVESSVGVVMEEVEMVWLLFLAVVVEEVEMEMVWLLFLAGVVEDSLVEVGVALEEEEEELDCLLLSWETEGICSSLAGSGWT